MCGIVGVYRSDGVDHEDRKRLDQAMDELRFRGPDGSGVWSGQKVLMGHTRLSILDPEGGQQPWKEGHSSRVLTYNGELYNHQELRGDLEKLGHSFRTECDTEVVFHAYEEWGVSCLQRFRGIFAFALFDPEDGCLWLVRDRLGVKPLYYSHHEGRCHFGSSLAAILKLSGERPRWNAAAVAHYLMTTRTDLGCQTLFEGIYSLEPGHSARVDLRSGQMDDNSYWSIPRLAAEDKLDVSLEMASEQVVDLLTQSFREQRLTSDVPVGAFLSGGIDSAILCGSLQQEGAALTAYSTGYERADYNEWSAMELTAKRCNVDWTRIQADEGSFWEDCELLIAHKGGPLSTPNEVPIFRMSEAFGRDCKVTLTGEGADEIFGGYTGPTFSALDYDRSLGAHGGVAPEALIRAYGQSHFASRQEHFLLANTWLQAGEIDRLAPRLAEADGLDRVQAWYDDLFNSNAHLTSFDAYLHVHARVNLEGLLSRLDSSTMRGSVEGRVPFTDHRVAEYLFSLPDSFKMQLSPENSWGEHRSSNVFEMDRSGAIETKRLLRRGYAQMVDPEILHRRKVSFPVPFMELLSGPLQSRLDACLERAPALTALLVGEGSLRQVLEASGAKRRLLAWLLMNLALTEQKWDVGY